MPLLQPCAAKRTDTPGPSERPAHGFVRERASSCMPLAHDLAVPRRLALTALALSEWLGGCGSNGVRTPVGEVGTYDPDGGRFASDDAGGPEPLDAYVEQDGTQVKIVTLTCSGPCADVQAVATNGNPPYTFMWEDGSTGAFRHVCPTATTSYSVTVRDTGMTGELVRAPMTVQVPLTADVIACPLEVDASALADAGSPPDASCVTITSADVAAMEPACPDPPGGQSLLRIELPPLQNDLTYEITLTTDLTANGGLSAQLQSYYSTGNCDRTHSGGTTTAVPASDGTLGFGGYTACFGGTVTQYKEYLVDFVPGIGGSGYTLGAWSLKLCGGPTCL